VAWDTAGKEFRCPCHGGRFDAQGRVTGGPPPRPLDTVPTRLEGDRILVDLA
jgi:Rieske Fe-S protein